jgi:hypothetical protein
MNDGHRLGASHSIPRNDVALVEYRASRSRVLPCPAGQVMIRLYIGWYYFWPVGLIALSLWTLLS